MTLRALALALATVLATLAACDERLVAHEVSAAGDGALEVPPGEHLLCFDVTAQIPSGPVVAIVPRLTAGVAHHVALHRAARAPIDRECASMGASTLLYVGSPGDDALLAPSGQTLSLERTEDAVFVLELHIVSSRAVADTSGVTLVVGEGRDEGTVGPWIVGDVQLDIPPRARAHEEGRSCTIRSEQPVTLHAVSPHMHARGVALSVVREREGVAETLIDVTPFDPLRQRTISLEPARTLVEGDRIHLRCLYDNPGDEAVHYGVRLEDEMCFAYFWASPISRLRGDAPFCH